MFLTKIIITVCLKKMSWRSHWKTFISWNRAFSCTLYELQWALCNFLLPSRLYFDRKEIKIYEKIDKYLDEKAIYHWSLTFLVSGQAQHGFNFFSPLSSILGGRASIGHDSPSHFLFVSFVTFGGAGASCGCDWDVPILFDQILLKLS